jgi:small conductance mechanosensitive channel
MRQPPLAVECTPISSAGKPVQAAAVAWRHGISGTLRASGLPSAVRSGGISNNVKGDAVNIDLATLEQAKGTLLIIALGFFVAGWAGRASQRSLQRMELDPPVRVLMTRIARVVVLLVFVMVALQNLGVELLPLIAGLGVAGAALALATQGVLGNVVAGLTIIFTKPYRVGDFIEIVAVEGRVEEISVFNTVLIHADRSRVVPFPQREVRLLGAAAH